MDFKSVEQLLKLLSQVIKMAKKVKIKNNFFQGYFPQFFDVNNNC